MRWVCVPDRNSSGGNNYVVAKYKSTADSTSLGKEKKAEFELVDWILSDGTSVNDVSGAQSSLQKASKVLGIKTEDLTQKTGQQTTTFQVPMLSVGPRIETSQELNVTYSDMVNLPVVHQATVLHNLKQRYMSNQFMTNIGSILIVINPFEYVALS